MRERENLSTEVLSLRGRGGHDDLGGWGSEHLYADVMCIHDGVTKIDVDGIEFTATI